MDAPDASVGGRRHGKCAAERPVEPRATSVVVERLSPFGRMWMAPLGIRRVRSVFGNGRWLQRVQWEQVGTSGKVCVVRFGPT